MVDIRLMELATGTVEFSLLRTRCYKYHEMAIVSFAFDDLTLCGRF